MTIFLILFAGIAVMIFAFRDDLKDDLADELEKRIMKNYNADSGAKWTEIIDELQEDLKCCGVRGGLNSSDSWFIWQSSQWYKNHGEPAGWLVPKSCCMKLQDQSACYRANGIATRPPQVGRYNVAEENEFLYSRGCIDELYDDIEDNIKAIAIVAAVALGILLICVISSVYVCTHVKENKDNKNEVV